MTTAPEGAPLVRNNVGPLDALRGRTPARVGLARSGVSMTTADLLAFQADHALARDAVHAAFDRERLAAAVTQAGLDCVSARSMSGDRGDYLRHPGNGRALTEESRAELTSLRSEPPWDVAVIVSDGLSATAANEHGASVVTPLVEQLRGVGLTVAPVVIVPFARVGLLDDVGATLGARSAVIVLGERPGLSAPDNLSIYLEVDPRRGRTDADRNCVSNIGAHGLAATVAAQQAAALLAEGLRRGVSGTALKTEYSPGPRSVDILEQ